MSNINNQNYPNHTLQSKSLYSLYSKFGKVRILYNIMLDYVKIKRVLDSHLYLTGNLVILKAARIFLFNSHCNLTPSVSNLPFSLLTLSELLIHKALIHILPLLLPKVICISIHLKSKSVLHIIATQLMK